MEFKKIPFRTGGKNCVQYAYANLFNDERFLHWPTTPLIDKFGMNEYDENDMLQSTFCKLRPHIEKSDLSSPFTPRFLFDRLLQTIDYGGMKKLPIVPAIGTIKSNDKFHAVGLIYIFETRQILIVDHLNENVDICDKLIHGISVIVEKDNPHNVVSNINTTHLFE